MTLRALIFDVDGTLADTEEAHRRAFNAAFVEHGLHWFWNSRLYTALLDVTGGKERLQFYIKHLDVPEEERAEFTRLVGPLHASKTQHYAQFMKDGLVPLRDGIADLIESARSSGVRLAIASTTTRRNIDELVLTTLNRAADTVFDVIACGDEVAHKKPAPDIYDLALKRLDITAVDCMALEDSSAGLSAAKAAGICTVVSPTHWTAANDFSGAHAVLRSFRDLGGVTGLRTLHAKCLATTEAA